MQRKVTIEELVTLYFDEGKSLSEVSKIVHLTKPNVRNRLVAAGHTLRLPMHKGWVNPNQAPSKHPSLLDIAWAAGVYEGEGSVIVRTGRVVTERGKGRPWVSIVQKDSWLCPRLRALFGGSVKQYVKRDGRAFYYWRLTGVRGVGFLMTIYAFLSPGRRRQILAAFDKTGLLRHSQTAMAQ